MWQRSGRRGEGEREGEEGEKGKGNYPVRKRDAITERIMIAKMERTIQHQA